MKELQIFQNSEFGQVRTLQIEGGSWFVGKDVADALGYSETNAMTKRLDEEDFISAKLEGMNMKSILINESGLYSAVLGSQLSSAKKFKRWVTSEVLPSIRKHGMYAKDELLDNPELLLDIVTKLTQERTKNKQLAADKETLQIKLDSSKDWYSIKRVAALNGIIWKSLDWRKLKQSGKLLGLEVRKIFDANYGEVNVYHKSAWEAAYPQYEL